jgi:phosphoribosylanthranilate isomerase
MLVKICGITNIDDAEAAVECGASAVGFVLWPESPRYVDAERVRAIVEALPPSVMKVGVFVNQPVAHVNEAAGAAGLTHVQLHGDETPEMAKAMTLPVIKATSLAIGQAALEAWPAETAWLVDAHDPVRRGGTGTKSDWSAAAALARTRRVWLAGGLTSENVAAAVEQVRPFGIDVSSAVERAPGMKDHDKLRALFDAVSRTATAEGDPSTNSGSSRAVSRDESLPSSAGAKK